MIDLRFVTLTVWPGAPTAARKNAPFRTSYTKTLDLLEFELKKIDARGIVIAAFYSVDQIRNDGWPRANVNPRDPGVILSFRKPEGPTFLKDGKWFVNVVPLSFPCDTYHHIEHNIHAIALSLEALRAVDRYGVTKRSEQYAGWKQIEAPTAGGFLNMEDAALFIATQAGVGVSNDGINNLIVDAATRQTMYRAAARRLHPDAASGNHELFVRLQQALALLEKGGAE